MSKIIGIIIFVLIAILLAFFMSVVLVSIITPEEVCHANNGTFIAGNPPTCYSNGSVYSFVPIGSKFGVYNKYILAPFATEKMK